MSRRLNLRVGLLAYAGLQFLGSASLGSDQPLHPAVQIQEWLPADLKELLRVGDMHAIYQRGINEFEVQLGNPIPEITGRHGGKVTQLPTAIRGRKTAILVAGGPCSLTLQWLDQLNAEKWKIEGYESIVVLTLYDGRDPVTTRVKHGIPRYEVEMPLPGYLAYLQWYPMMFFVDGSGRLEGFQESPITARRMRESIKP